METIYASTYDNDVSIEHNNKTYYVISSVGLTPGVGWYYKPWAAKLPEWLKVYTMDTSYFYENSTLSGYTNVVSLNIYQNN